MLKAFFTALCNPAQSAAPIPLNDVTTPDSLISGYIIQSFLKDFDDWKADDIHYLENETYSHYASECAPRLTNKKLGIQVQWGCERYKSSTYGYKLRIKFVGTTFMKFKGERHNLEILHKFGFDKKESKLLFESWESIAAKVKKAKQIAAEALATMKENEVKWNIAEELLGMKRNKLGALVPADQAWDNCDCDLGESCEGCGATPGAPAPTPAPELVDPFPKTRKPRAKKEKLVDPFK